MRWVKGHGTENDFLVLPDPDGTVHGQLDADFVVALCDRRRGIGADGVLRALRTSALAQPDASGLAGPAEWFMDYRNSDGSLSQMCGNGIRVFALHLAREGLVDTVDPLPIATRGGIKWVTFADDGLISVDMGTARPLPETKIGVQGRTWPAYGVDLGNPHAVVLVEDLDDAGPLLDPPDHDDGVFGEGVNVEFVRRVAPGHLAMRVHERGSGETRSCGTGACAAVVAVTQVAGDVDASGPAMAPASDLAYQIEVAGGRLDVTWCADGHLHLAGPAEIVAAGAMTWSGC
ncbi:MAG: diaminopimelate epimerase [Nocardioidaceae bacterium]